MNVRLVSLQGGDKFNVSVSGTQHQERVRPDGAWIVDHKVAETLCRHRSAASLNAMTTKAH
jgi:hypothetical protein